MINRKIRMCLILAAAMLTLGSMARANMVLNGDMEEGGGPTTPPTSWFLGIGDVVAGVSSDTPSGSGQSMYVTNDGTENYQGIVIQLNIPLHAYTNYVLSFSYKGAALRWYLEYDGAGTYAASNLSSSPSTWANYSYSGTAPAGTTSARLYLYAIDPDTTVLFDNVSLDIQKHDGKCYVSDWASPSLHNALVQLNSLDTQSELVIDKNDSLTQNEAVDKEISLNFISGNMITVPNYNLTINGPINAGPFQIFNYTGTGTVTFVDGGIVNAYPQWWGAKGDWNGSTGTDNLEPLDSAFSSGAKVLSIPSGNYYIGDSDGITIPADIGVVKGAGADKTTITYAGTGSAITEDGARITMSDLTVRVLDDEAIGISFINACRKASLRNVNVTFSPNSASNTGTGILLDGTGGWIGGIDFDNIQVVGFKYGIETIGTGSSNTVTAITGKNVWLIGNSTGVIANSCGIYMDAYTNGVGSVIKGGTIEFFAIGIKIEDGAANGFGYGHGIGYVGDFEGNTVDWEVGNAFNGEIVDLNNGPYIKQATNGTANIWYQDKYTFGGVRTTFNRYSQYFDFSNNGDSLKWGAIQGEVPVGGFAFAGSGDVAPQKNYIYHRTHKITWSTVAPTDGAWERGDVCFNRNAAVGSPKGWVCTTSGTPGTWVSMGNL